MPNNYSMSYSSSSSEEKKNRRKNRYNQYLEQEVLKYLQRKLFRLSKRNQLLYDEKYLKELLRFGKVNQELRQYQELQENLQRIIELRANRVKEKCQTESILSVEEFISFSEILEETSIPSITDSVRFWIIRTNDGYFYNEYLQESFVAVGWNYLDNGVLFKKDEQDSLKKKVKEIYNEKNPENLIHNSNQFIFEMKPGDYVLIPNKGRTYYSICELGEYYEEEYSYDDELEALKNISAGLEGVKCPYKKRREIVEIFRISSARLGIKLINAISNYHGISCLDNYAEDILNCVYDCYEYLDFISFTINVSKQQIITAKECSRLFSCISELFGEIVTDENEIALKIQFSSPGRTNAKIKKKYLKKGAMTLLVIYFIIFGGKGLGFEFDGVIDKVINVIKTASTIELEKEQKEASLIAQKLENCKKANELIEAFNESGLDAETIIEQMKNIIDLNITLQFENNKDFANENNENMIEDEDEPSEDSVSEE